MARPGKKKRRYSDEDRANALAGLIANRGNVTLTADQLGIPATTLRAWQKGDRHPEATQLCAEKKGPLADELERVAWKLADAIPNKIEKTGLQPLVTSLGIVIDKMQLLRNKPTSINRDELGDDDLRDLTDDELDKELAAAQRRAAAPPDPGATGRPDASGTNTGGEVPPTS